MNDIHSVEIPVEFPGDENVDRNNSNIYFYFGIALVLSLIAFAINYGKKRHSFIPVPSFAHDIEDGLTSDNFNIVLNNLDENDTRKGLDENAKSDILKIMAGNKGMSFDDARLFYTKNKMKENGIGPDGRPLDPKAVFFN